MKSSSLKIVKNYGISSPRAYRDILIHEWHLPSYLPNQTHTVKVLYKCRTDNLFDFIKDGELKLNHSSYSVTWLTGPKSLRSYEHCLLSFRWSYALNCGYVLIKAFEPPVGDTINCRYTILTRDMLNGN